MGLREEREYREDWNAHIRLYPQDKVFRFLLDPIVPKKVKPNHLTVLRFLLTPVVLFFLVRENYLVGVPLFLFAAWTDTLDGSLARVRHEITEWGILYDPLADKLLIGSVLFVIVVRHVNPVLGYALLGIEAIVIIGASIRHRRGKIEPANIWGKIKMVSEVVGICLLLIALWLHVNTLVDLSAGTLTIALVTAIVSILTRLHA